GAVDVVEDRTRDDPARGSAQLVDVVAGREPPAGGVELDRLELDQAAYLRCPHVPDDTRFSRSPSCPVPATAPGSLPAGTFHPCSAPCCPTKFVRCPPGT